MRQLSRAEATQWDGIVLDEDCLEEHFLSEDLPSLTWTDDNSNFAGVFQGGPLEGWVFFLDHEELRPLPRYRDAQLFRKALFESQAQDFHELPTEYPKQDASATDSEDLDLARYYRKRWFQKGPGATAAALRSLILLPVKASAEALEFLDTENMWVQEAAVQVLAQRRQTSSASLLSRVVLEGTHNGRLAALAALSSWGLEGAGYLAELKKVLPAGYESYFRNLK